MVKPSQQIAEEMVCYAENSIAQRRPNYNNLHSMDREVAKAILSLEIPLTQLIEVARAANRTELSNSECTCYSNPEGSCRFCNYFIDLAKKLNDLKQTGKAEWL